MDTSALSVFFPCINEEGNIEKIVKRADEVLKKLKIPYEIIIVNDGSTDQTGNIAETLSKEDPKVRVIHHCKNLGYGEALKSGFYNSKYDTIVYTDGDGQFDFAEVTKFLEKIKDYDLVMGYRIKRKDPFFRILFKLGWKISLFAFFGLTLRDVDCGFKMVRKRVLEKITHLESTRGAMINAELPIKAKKAGFRITEVGVTHYPRLFGNPTGANLRVIIRSYFDLFKLWWKLKDQKLSLVLLLGILALASFLRFYRLPEYMAFLGDEGRDALVIKGMLVDYHFPLIGPPTSVGNIYLGPLYYYMMAVPMAIFWLNPVAAAGMNAFIGVLTVALIYYLGKVWFGKLSGLISSFLYAISSVNIIYSRSSWNPNPAPFFSLLGILSLYRLHESGNFLWLILTGFAIGAAVQMHYLAVILIPIALLLWVSELYFRNSRRLNAGNLKLGTLLGIVSFISMISPLIWFDLRHNFLNFKAITLLLRGGKAVAGNIFTNAMEVPSLYVNNLIGRYISAEDLLLTFLVSLMVVFGLVYQYKKNFWPKFILGNWLFVGLLGISYYSYSVYDHYFGFLNPAPFLLLGALTLYISNTSGIKKVITSGLFIVLLIALTTVNIQRNPLQSSPNNQLERTKDVAKFVIERAESKAFNFALLAQTNYDSAYQFYLEQYGHKPKKVPFEITDQLFVVCEDQFCDPTHSPKYEVAAFGWSRIEWMEERFGVKIYRLVHNPSGKP